MVNRLLPYTNHFLKLKNGIRYHYLDEGEGAPVVMLHGNPSWCYYYRNLVERLRGSHRVIVPDHIGCGLSDKPGDDSYDYTLSSRVADLEQLLEHLDIDRDITLVVHDWGGMIGMAYATRYPQRIAKLVVLNTSAFHLPASKPLPLPLKICRDSAVGSFLVRALNAFAVAAAFVGCKRHPMPRALRCAYTAPYNNWKNRIATLRFVQDIPLAPGDKAWDEVTRVEDNLHQLRHKPLLICWGERDFVFDHHFLALWQSQFPSAQIHRCADAGHYVLEDAASEIIPRICAFITADTTV